MRGKFAELLAMSNLGSDDLLDHLHRLVMDYNGSLREPR
jgi:hypothetical protein